MNRLKDALLAILIAIFSITIGLWLLGRSVFFIVFLVVLPLLLITPLRVIFGGKAFPYDWIISNFVVFFFSGFSAVFIGMTLPAVIGYLVIHIGEVNESIVYPFVLFFGVSVGMFTLITLTRNLVENKLKGSGSK